MIKNFAVYLPSVILPRVTAFAVIAFGSHILPPAELGYFSLIVLIGEALDAALINWIRVALARFGASTGSVSSELANRTAAMATAALILAILISVIAVNWLAPERYSSVLTATILYLIAASVSRLGVSLLQTSGRSALASSLESARALCSLATSLLTMVLTESAIASSLATSSIGLVIGTLCLAIGMRKTIRAGVYPTSWSTFSRFALPLVAIALLSQLISSTDKVLIKYYFDSSMLAMYTVAFAVGRSGFDAMAIAFNTGTFIRISALYNKGSPELAARELRKQLSYILAIFLPAFGALLASIDNISSALFPQQYHSSMAVSVPIVAVGAVFLNLKSFVYDNVFHLHLANSRQIPSLVGGALVSLCVGAIVVPQSALLGASLMFASGGFTALLLSFLMSSRFMRVTISATDICKSAALGTATWISCGAISYLLSNGAAALLLQAGIAILLALASLSLSYLLLSPKLRKFGIVYITTDPSSVTGISSYTNNLVSSICAADQQQSIVLYTNADKNILDKLETYSIEWVSLPQNPIFIPFKIYNILAHQAACVLARIHGCERFLSTTPWGALIPIVRQVVTIHDTYDLNSSFRPLRTVLYSKLLWRWIRMTSWKVCCVSKSTAAEYANSIKTDIRDISVTLEGSKYPSRPALIEAGEHFLYVANIQPVKNVKCLLDAVRLSSGDVQVDWVGRDPSNIIAISNGSYGDPPGFRRRGVLSEQELEQAYAGSFALIVCSWTEGFCLPVLEAQAFGVPVVASDIPILREVAGAGAIYFDPNSPDDLLKAIRSLQSRPDLRKELSAAALKNNSRFSWDSSARLTLDLLKTT